MDDGIRPIDENGASELVFERVELGEERDLEERPLKSKVINAGVLVVAALISLLLLANIASSPSTYSGMYETLDEKKLNVMGLAATTTAASAAISVLPIRERGILQQAFLLIAKALQGIEAQVVCIAAAVGNCSVRLVEFNILGILLFIAYLVSRFKSILITIRRQDNGLVGIHSHTVEGNFALLPIHIGNGDRRFGVGLIDGVQQIPGQVVGSLDIVIGFSDLKLRRKLRCGFVLPSSATKVL